MNALPALNATPAAPPAAPGAGNGSTPTHGGAAEGADEAPKFARELERASKPADKGPARPGTNKTESASETARRSAAKPAAHAAEQLLQADTQADTADEPPAIDDEAPADAGALLAGLLSHQPRPAEQPVAAEGAKGKEAGGVDALRARASPVAAEGGTGPATPRLAAEEDRLPTAKDANPAFALPTAAAPVVAPAPRPEAVATGADVRVPSHVASPEFAPAIGAQVSLLVKDGVQEARLQLNPAEMGPVTVQIQVDGSQAQVTFAAEHAFTRERIEQALPALAGALQENGLTLTGGGVFEQQPRQQQGDAPGDGRGRGGAPDGKMGGSAEIAATPARAARAVRSGLDVYA